MVLLSHRPELLGTYTQYGVNLVLSGHSHGGQLRLPLLGGMYAPHQGLLPEYDGGRFTQEDTQMIVSRGIGNSLFPLRINNRPEVVLITLRAR
jgi:predicted MPP superfamily phosphohydrolase